MAAMFVAMVWHARRRLVAMEETERVSMANLRLLERQRQFVQDASHELRAPITVALGHAELIQRTTTDETKEEDAGVIVDELMRLRRLADRLLILAGTEDPDFLHPRPVDLEALVVEAVRRWTATPRRWLLGSAEEAIVLADAERLTVALDALIENAVTHTREQDTIEVTVHRQGNQAIVSVHDTGAGIHAADLDSIFDRFARVDPGRSRNTGGAGLGLPIVKAIVEAHQGTIHVESTQGNGTTFEISLPIADSAQVVAPTPEQRELEPTPPRRDVTSDVGRRDVAIRSGGHLRSAACGNAVPVADRRVRRQRGEHGAPRSRRRLFLGGLIAIFVALETPFDAAADTSLSVHMVQHLLLTMVAAPLLVAGGAMTLALRAYPGQVRRWGRHSSPAKLVPSISLQSPCRVGHVHRGPMGLPRDGAVRRHTQEPRAARRGASRVPGDGSSVLDAGRGSGPTPSRISHAARILYLFLAMPAMAFLDSRSTAPSTSCIRRTRRSRGRAGRSRTNSMPGRSCGRAAWL